MTPGSMVGEIASPPSNQQSGSPIPTVAATLGIGDRRVLAGGIAAPYADSTATSTMARSVTRQSVSAFMEVTVGAAYRVTARLRIGATTSPPVDRSDYNI